MKCYKKGFTLVELLTVLSIVSVLIAIMMPALGRARRRGRSLQGLNHQRHIVGAVSQYAIDHRDRYPDSVATIGDQDNWGWQEPMVLTGYQKRSPRLHRSVSAYLYRYISNAGIMFCPSAPNEYPYLQQAWDAGDDWDNPSPHTRREDPVYGVYCFYWNYIGFLDERTSPFRGPRTMASQRRYSKILVSDYFGYGHWRDPLCYGSCERLDSADVTSGTPVSSDYWSRRKEQGVNNLPDLDIVLHAGYTDGHVESYSPMETTTMKVSITSDGSYPYPSGAGPGDFYLPKNALY